jgi:hypothetical protein
MYRLTKAIIKTTHNRLTRTLKTIRNRETGGDVVSEAETKNTVSDKEQNIRLFNFKVKI